jgi:hypothetical protein
MYLTCAPGAGRAAGHGTHSAGHVRLVGETKVERDISKRG